MKRNGENKKESPEYSQLIKISLHSRVPLTAVLAESYVEMQRVGLLLMYVL